MGDNVAKGNELFAKADKKLKGFGFFGNKYEEAAEMLEKAANYYKLGKAWPEAVEAYRLLAQTQLKQNSKHDAATAFVEGAKCAAKVSQGDSVQLLQQAVDLYTDMGRLNMAARQLRDIAEAQEKQGSKEEAMQFYTKAADLFQTENATSDANKCRLKVAEFSAELERYPEAVEVYEDVARTCTESNLLRFSAKGYLLQAGICVLCYANEEDIRIKLERYKDIDLQFSGSREAILLEACADALADADEKKFATAVQEYDSMTRLDAWKTNMLLRVKRRIQARQAGEEGEEDEPELL